MPFSWQVQNVPLRQTLQGDQAKNPWARWRQVVNLWHKDLHGSFCVHSFWSCETISSSWPSLILDAANPGKQTVRSPTCHKYCQVTGRISQLGVATHGNLIFGPPFCSLIFFRRKRIPKLVAAPKAASMDGRHLVTVRVVLRFREHVQETGASIRSYGGFLKWGYPKNGWFVVENTIKMDNLGVPPFQETPISNLEFSSEFHPSSNYV